MNTTYRKSPAFIVLAMLAAGFLAFAGPPPGNGQRPMIITDSGVRVVLNPAEPIYGQIKLDLEEDLRIGGEGDERTQFYRVRDVAVDLQGNIYVDDMSNSRVQVFGPSGDYLRTIGRAGQGPGEFEMPTLIHFGGQGGYTHVRDRYRRINLFDSKGVFVRSVVVDGNFTSFFPDAASGFMAILTKGSDEDLTSFHALSRISGEGKTQAVLAQFPYTIHMERREGGTLAVTTGYEMSLYAAPLAGNSLVYGYSKDYELVILGLDDRKLLVIRMDEPRPEFTADEKKEFGRIPVPKLKPYFFGIMTDSEDRIYVQRNANTKGRRGYGPIATEDKLFDVFSRDGRFLYRTALPPNTRVIRGDLVYTYFIDEDQGLEYVQRFRIKNYADLPTK